jgi:dihydrolipoamide dehydrogenase
MVKEYDIIAFGTGSAMNIVSVLINMDPSIKVAVVENEKVGGICLTRGCIPSKMILYPAELMHEIKRAKTFFIDVDVKNVDPGRLLRKIREEIDQESRIIEESLKRHPSIDLYRTTGELTGDYTVDVDGKEIRGEKILLCTGSRPLIPPIDGLEETGYITSKEFFYNVENIPKSVAIIGGGYVALELGFFMSMMGSKVTIVEMFPRILIKEEPEISSLIEKELSSYMDIYTRFKVVEADKRNGLKRIHAVDEETGETLEVSTEEILVATGRRSNSDITKPEKTGVKTDKQGWIVTNEYLETSKEDIYACGDANGKYMYKHVANYESEIVFYNAFTGRKIKADYHAVPHAIFTYPEIASVGMLQEEAEKNHDILIGFYRYHDTAKGEAMRVRDYFVKVILEKETYKILGAHIIGPHASILIQEIINLMYTSDGSALPLYRTMHIHPALPEVIQRAFFHLHELEDYRRHHNIS